ncbi:flagellar protein FliS [Pseudotabrizicola algicola]|uniref:Flagellar protein FliS n=1 Tax=Pseudotabrizicola algicola TaxID=2709381 RepID=A0A6B3RGZ5_9RHOB|nr:flagellar protein FliS [Pseudotabrizicola algicola]NEX45240.1 flagellar protein FliS [Pseudotabrizicola algicola]
MSLHLARQTYKRAAQTDDALPADPHAVIGVALAELHSALGTLAAAAELRRPLPPRSMTLALSSIYLLQSSLDFERGGEIATSLFQVYEYCREQVAVAFRDKGEGADGLARATEFIATLREAWQSMDARGAAG